MPPTRLVNASKLVTASNDDVELLFALEQQLFEENIRFSRRQFKYLVQSENALTLICLHDGEPIGYGIALKNKLRNGMTKGRIYSLGVLRKGRRQGLGSKLLKALE
jgi:ribosomal protein S18 acetylase RimI-like enzyme